MLQGSLRPCYFRNLRYFCSLTGIIYCSHYTVNILVGNSRNFAFVVASLLYIAFYAFGQVYFGLACVYLSSIQCVRAAAVVSPLCVQ